MAHKNYLNELDTIQTIISKINTMSRLNESIVFEDEDFDVDPEYGAPIGDENMQQGPANSQDVEQGVEQGKAMSKDPEDAGMEELDEMGEIDKIREITLSGMHKLCQNPQDPKYQALKKIFQMCDKGVEEEMKNQQQMQ